MGVNANVDDFFLEGKEIRAQLSSKKKQLGIWQDGGSTHRLQDLYTEDGNSEWKQSMISTCCDKCSNVWVSSVLLFQEVTSIHQGHTILKGPFDFLRRRLEWRMKLQDVGNVNIPDKGSVPDKRGCKITFWLVGSKLRNHLRWIQVLRPCSWPIFNILMGSAWPTSGKR